MSNLFRSLSSLIGGRADDPSARGRTQSSTTLVAASAPSPHAEPAPASSSEVVESHLPDVVSAPPNSTLDLPLVDYVPPRAEGTSPRPRRARAVGLLRSAGATAITSRALPTLPSVELRHADQAAGPMLTQTERVRLQIMQAQIQLSVLRLYEGPIDGQMSAATVKAVRYFQTLKGIRATGLLAVGTLAALGVPPIA